MNTELLDSNLDRIEKEDAEQGVIDRKDGHKFGYEWFLTESTAKERQQILKEWDFKNAYPTAPCFENFANINAILIDDSIESKLENLDFSIVDEYEFTQGFIEGAVQAYDDLEKHKRAKAA